MEQKPLSVSELNRYIGRVMIMDPLLSDVVVKGEVSGVKFHASSHIYFTLKDETSKINCFFSSYYNKKASKLPEEGEEILVTGLVSVYEQGGTYSINVREITEAGEGSLSLKFEKLKEKLEKEGLFKEEFKKRIPPFSTKIAVITSDTGAAMEDIISTLRKRNKGLTIRVFPSLVQGDQAPSSLIKALYSVNSKFPDTDVIIMGRGGGSIEDLWAFNNEDLARAIFASKIPVISAVGHETDITIADFVADVRAKTPTEAGILAVPDSFELNVYIKDLHNNLIKEIKEIYNNKNLKLKANSFSELILLLFNKAEAQSNMLLSTRVQMRRDIENLVTQRLLTVDKLRDSIDERMNSILFHRESQLASLGKALMDLDPKNIMKRGYSIVLDENKKAVRSIKSLKQGSKVTLRLVDGEAEGAITGVKEN